ncbi:class I SAM-dependent methyltransferase [Telmatospirillum sp.]|uniref:class I SAM-dependent methyltransferase n=1 Tax=Telmatospirillum sp. TaxID=2079197 RepID=UPI00284F8C75|nr:class I SAM-dependent methyltransferase [Telmatospirillum sp.]MDR3437857.1 class I SAM-dependent methyltransferase [Telmatospirillum sp.]
MTSPQTVPIGTGLTEIRERTRAYYNAVGSRYFELFKDELAQKTDDRALLTRFSELLGLKAELCDAGCGPCGHVTRFLADQGLHVTGVDLSDRCIDLARAAQPELTFRVMDMARMDFGSGSLDGLVAYYSILYTPKAHLPTLFQEFHRVLKPRGKLLVVVEEGDGEGWIPDPMGTGEPTYWVDFREPELRSILESNGFHSLYSAVRDPYHFEIQVRRISVIAETIAYPV